MRTTEPPPTEAEPATGASTGRPRRSASATRGVLVGATAVVVVAAALGVAMLHRGSRPPQLVLTGVGGGTAGGALGSGPAPQLGAPAEGAGSGGSRYVLRGTLPTGPAQAAVRRFSAPADADARALAVSLADAAGVSGTPRRVDGRWEVASGSRVVRVAIAPGAPWTYARDDATACLPLPGAATDSIVSCGAASGSASGSGATPAPVPGDAALTAAAPLLRAVGLEPRAAHLVGAGATALVLADPVVDGFATVGLTTSVEVDRGGVVTAQGWAPQVVRGDSYPLVSARDAFDVLQRQPQPAIACRAPADEHPGARPSAPPGCGNPLVVVGAELGLGLQWSGETPLLAPTWLFALDGSDLPVPVLAVQPEYVGTGPTPTGSATPELGGAVPLPDPTGGLPSPGARPGTPRSP